MSDFAENSPAGVVDSVEVLARFVISKRWVRENKTVQSDAFIPPPDLQLSTTRHKGLTAQELWNVCATIAAHTYIASASMVVSSSGRSNMTSWPQDRVRVFQPLAFAFS